MKLVSTLTKCPSTSDNTEHSCTVTPLLPPRSILRGFFPSVLLSSKAEDGEGGALPDHRRLILLVYFLTLLGQDSRVRSAISTLCVTLHFAAVRESEYPRMGV